MPEEPAVQRSGIERHRVDGFALTTGLLAIAVASLALAARADAFEVDGLVVLATVWVVLGVVGLTKALHRLLSRPDPDPGPPSPG